jgi:hypothetical protein
MYHRHKLLDLIHQNFVSIKHLNLTSTNLLSGNELCTKVGLTEFMGNVTLYRCFSNLPEPYKTFLRETDELTETHDLLFIHTAMIQ